MEERQDLLHMSFCIYLYHILILLTKVRNIKAHRLYYHSTKNGNGYKINMIEFIGDVNL